MEPIYSSVTWVHFHGKTRCYIPEDALNRRYVASMQQLKIMNNFKNLSTQQAPRFGYVPNELSLESRENCEANDLSIKSHPWTLHCGKAYGHWQSACLYCSRNTTLKICRTEFTILQPAISHAQCFWCTQNMAAGRERTRSRHLLPPASEFLVEIKIDRRKYIKY